MEEPVRRQLPEPKCVVGKMELRQWNGDGEKRKIFRGQKHRVTTSNVPSTVFPVKVTPGVGEVSSPGGLSQRLKPLWCHLGF